MEDHAFCRMALAETKREAKQAGVHVGKLTVWRSDLNPTRPQFQIYQDGKAQADYITAHCAADAKCKFVSRLISNAEDECARARLFGGKPVRGEGYRWPSREGK